MRATNKTDWDDLKSILSMKKEYYTTEGLVPDIKYEYRIQKIGSGCGTGSTAHYRGFKRMSDNCWKGNWGNLRFEDHKLDAFDIMWADEVSKIFGGLDIVAIDVLQKTNGYVID